MMSLGHQLRAALDEKDATALRRTLRAVPEGVLDLASNDYLGLARHPEVIEAACAALRNFGAGARASRLVSGHTALHAQLEDELAAWKKCEAALVFPSGYHANLATITALARRGDIIFCDKRNHASLIDACRLADAQGAIVRYYTTLNYLAALLENYAQKREDKRLLVVSDTVYSMDGDLADLPRLCELSTSYDAVLILDDAHGTGTLGATGAGAWEFWQSKQLSFAEQTYLDVVHIGTLSKALGSQGGFVCASRVVIDWLINAARPFIYTTGLSPANCGAALAAVQLVRREPKRIEHLRAVAEKLAGELCAVGYDARLQPSPILPIFVGEAEAALKLSEVLLQRGAWCPAIRPPTVPVGTSRLRLTANADWDAQKVAQITSIFIDAQKVTA